MDTDSLRVKLTEMIVVHEEQLGRFSAFDPHQKAWSEWYKGSIASMKWVRDTLLSTEALASEAGRHPAGTCVTPSGSIADRS